MDLPYERYFDAVPCYVTVLDSAYRIVAANARLREDFGEAVGRFCYQLYKRREEPCQECPVGRTFRDGQCHESEQTVRCLDGRELAVLVHTKAVLDDQGRVASVTELMTDVNDLKLLQRQLRESEECHRLLFEEVPCYISVQDPDLRVVEANRRFKEEFGDPRGRFCYEVYKHRGEQCVPCAVQETFLDGLVHHSEEVVTSSQRGARNVLVYTAPIRDARGETVSVVEMSTDITPIRELESQLSSLGLLIGSLSHGIKGLLTGLDGGIYLVNSALARGDQARLTQGWEMVRRNVERIRSLVLNILYYAKDREPHWEAVSLEALTEEALSAVATRAQESRVRFVRQYQPDDGVFEADAKAIRALLINVLENSVDACRIDQKKSAHEVTVRLRGAPAEVCVEIEDNGIGMERESREKAFTLFFSSKGTEGTGLGLFIADRIVKTHGGSIAVESEVGRGTLFRIVMPRERLAAQKPVAGVAGA
jgi:PAS domain S-box-containing protein